jgi:hypothetical protein
MPRNELHGIVVDAFVLTHSIDWHDVAVVQPGRRARFKLKPLNPGRAEPPRERQDLECDVPSQGFLDRLVHDPHPASRDFPKHPEIAQPVPRQAGLIVTGLRHRHVASFASLADGLDAFHHHERGKEVGNGLGELRVLAGVLAQRGMLTLPLPLDELLGQLFDGISIPLGIYARYRHVQFIHPGASSSDHGSRRPGIPARLSLSRLRART